jgi:hypothetical protein
VISSNVTGETKNSMKGGEKMPAKKKKVVKAKLKIKKVKTKKSTGQLSDI